MTQRLLNREILKYWTYGNPDNQVQVRIWWSSQEATTEEMIGLVNYSGSSAYTEEK